MGGELCFGMVGGMYKNKRGCVFTVSDVGLCQANLCEVMLGIDKHYAL
jgi:hypothetical protein